MRKLLICTALIAAIFSSYGQGALTKLDEKNGFKDIKLGGAYSKWQNDIIFSHSNTSTGAKVYKYQGTCCQKVFESTVDFIYLTFKNSILVGIDIQLVKFQQGSSSDWVSVDLTKGFEYFESLKSKFSQLFGPPTGSNMEPNPSKNTPMKQYDWIAKEVYLACEYYFNGTYDSDHARVVVCSIDYLNQTVEDGF